jgi:hypothetical protein
MFENATVEFRRLEKNGFLGFANVKEGPMLIKGFSLFKGKDGREYDLFLPSEADKKGTLDEKSGKVKRWPTILFDKTEDGRNAYMTLKKKIISAYEEATSGEANPSSQQTSSPTSNEIFGDNIPF